MKPFFSDQQQYNFNAESAFMKNELLRSWIIFSCSLFHILLMYSFPVDGGGSALFFTLTVPFIIVLSIILSLIYYFKTSKNPLKIIRNIQFYGSVLLLLIIGYTTFPCSDKEKLEIPSRPCPCIYLGKNKQKIKYTDIFDDGYYSTLKKTSALKKFKNDLPEKYYDISFSTNKKSYVIYFKKGKVFSTNRNLKITITDSNVTYFEKDKLDTIIFKSNKYDFNINDDEYTSQNNDGNFEKKFKDLHMQINKGILKREKEYFIYNILYSMM